MSASDQIRRAIRDIPDFPKPGILFRDITPILKDPEIFRLAISEFVRGAKAAGAQKIAGIDARGFLFGATVAHELNVGFVPIRKKGKLPFSTLSEAYDLEYGSAEVEVHSDAFEPGERVVLIDDLLATGGTAAAAIRLIQRAGGTPVLTQFLIELAGLNGRKALGDVPVSAIISYS
jgi:adenine phosphoribosyltransferase